MRSPVLRDELKRAPGYGCFTVLGDAAKTMVSASAGPGFLRMSCGVCFTGFLGQRNKLNRSQTVALRSRGVVLNGLRAPFHSGLICCGKRQPALRPEYAIRTIGHDFLLSTGSLPQVRSWETWAPAASMR
jgi:hypothetical protein